MLLAQLLASEEIGKRPDSLHIQCVSPVRETRTHPPPARQSPHVCATRDTPGRTGASVLLATRESTKPCQAMRCARIAEQSNMLSLVQHPARRVRSTRTHLHAAQSLRPVYATRDTSDRVAERVWRVAKANTPLLQTARHALTAARVNTQRRRPLRVNLCAPLVQPTRKRFNLAKARRCRAVSATLDGKGHPAVHVRCVAPGNTDHRF